MKNFLLKKMALPTVVLLWAAAYYIEVMGYSAKNHRMIQPIFWVMVLLYVINGITDYREWKREQAGGTAAKDAAPARMDRTQAAKLVALIGCMAAYVLLLNVTGFVLTTVVFTCAVLLLMGERKWYLLVGIPVLLAAVLYVAFKIALGIPLPTGFLGF